MCAALQAIEAGRGAGDDWAEFKHRHQQAAVDSDLLYSVLQQAQQHHEVGLNIPDDLPHHGERWKQSIWLHYRLPECLQTAALFCCHFTMSCVRPAHVMHVRCPAASRCPAAFSCCAACSFFFIACSRACSSCINSLQPLLQFPQPGLHCHTGRPRLIIGQT